MYKIGVPGRGGTTELDFGNIDFSPINEFLHHKLMDYSHNYWGVQYFHNS